MIYRSHLNDALYMMYYLYKCVCFGKLILAKTKAFRNTFTWISIVHPTLPAILHDNYVLGIHWSVEPTVKFEKLVNSLFNIVKRTSSYISILYKWSCTASEYGSLIKEILLSLVAILFYFCTYPVYYHVYSLEIRYIVNFIQTPLLNRLKH